MQLKQCTEIQKSIQKAFRENKYNDDIISMNITDTDIAIKINMVTKRSGYKIFTENIIPNYPIKLRAIEPCIIDMSFPDEFYGEDMNDNIYTVGIVLPDTAASSVFAYLKKFDVYGIKEIHLSKDAGTNKVELKLITLCSLNEFCEMNKKTADFEIELFEIYEE